MNFEDVKKYFGTYGNFQKKTGMGKNTLTRWKNIGYIPPCSQKRLEQLTNGELKAYWNKEENKGNV